VIVTFPVIGGILGTFGKSGKHKSLAIAANILYFCVVSPLELLNLLILAFGNKIKGF
jgi:hypothetical protein